MSKILGFFLALGLSLKLNVKVPKQKTTKLLQYLGGKDWWFWP